MLFRSGVPTVHADRSFVWEGNTVEILNIQNPADVGMGINVTSSGTNVNVNVQCRFGINLHDGVKLSVYMLED